MSQPDVPATTEALLKALQKVQRKDERDIFRHPVTEAQVSRGQGRGCRMWAACSEIRQPVAAQKQALQRLARGLSCKAAHCWGMLSSILTLVRTVCPHCALPCRNSAVYS